MCDAPPVAVRQTQVGIAYRLGGEEGSRTQARKQAGPLTATELDALPCTWLGPAVVQGPNSTLPTNGASCEAQCSRQKNVTTCGSHILRTGVAACGVATCMWAASFDRHNITLFVLVCTLCHTISDCQNCTPLTQNPAGDCMGCWCIMCCSKGWQVICVFQPEHYQCHSGRVSLRSIRLCLRLQQRYALHTEASHSILCDEACSKKHTPGLHSRFGTHYHPHLSWLCVCSCLTQSPKHR